MIDDNDIPGHPHAIDDTEDDCSDNDYSDTDNVHLDEIIKASLDIIREYRQTPQRHTAKLIHCRLYSWPHWNV